MTFAGFASGVARASGSPWAFGLATASILAWAALGPVYGYSDAWSLSVNTGTTIITFLLLFVVQHTQIRDAADAKRENHALHAKLDELIRVTEARDDLIGLDQQSEDVIESVRATQPAPATLQESDRRLWRRILGRARP